MAKELVRRGVAVVGVHKLDSPALRALPDLLGDVSEFNVIASGYPIGLYRESQLLLKEAAGVELETFWRTKRNLELASAVLELNSSMSSAVDDWRESQFEEDICIDPSEEDFMGAAKAGSYLALQRMGYRAGLGVLTNGEGRSMLRNVASTLCSLHETKGATVVISRPLEASVTTAAINVFVGGNTTARLFDIRGIGVARRNPVDHVMSTASLNLLDHANEEQETRFQKLLQDSLQAEKDDLSRC